MRSDLTRPNCSRPSDTKDFAIKLGGAAILAGLISGNPKLRKYLACTGAALLATALAPDFIRYMKIESM